MSSTKPPVGAAPLRSPLHRFAELAREGFSPNTIFVLKTLFAAFLSLYIAMVFDLPQPKTAMTTVFIVMQPQSGMVLAKSFYRLCGTLVGLIVALTLMACFAQQPELFAISIAVWMGICTAGAARNRNFRSYGFLLAGYTPALIGFPASLAPDGLFLNATTRVLEVALGILCSGIVSATLFPQPSESVGLKILNQRFATFIDFIAEAFAGSIDRQQFAERNAHFAADIVRLEAARAAAAFEGAQTRDRQRAFARINAEFMAVSTRFHALQQIVQRLKNAGMATVVAELDGLFDTFDGLMAQHGGRHLGASGIAAFLQDLAPWRAALPARIAARRAALDSTDGDLLEFDTGAESFTRFVDDFSRYAGTYSAFITGGSAVEQGVFPFRPRTSAVTSSIAGFRATVVVLVLAAFWIGTAWTSGVMATLIGGAVCALASTFPHPKRTVMQMTLGTALAVAAGMVVTFVAFPAIDHFVLMALVLTPFLALGAYMLTQPKVAAVGVGFCIFFSFLAGPDNYMVYRPAAFMNDGIALVGAMLVASLAYAMIFPPDGPWLKRRLLKLLRKQVVEIARRGPRQDRRHDRIDFESSVRDLTFQLNALPAQTPAFRQESIDWMFIVLEVGNALLDLQSRGAGVSADDDRSGEIGPAMEAVFAAVCRYFAHPTARHRTAALAATGRAIAHITGNAASTDVGTAAAGSAAAASTTTSGAPVARYVTDLHLIRGALLELPPQP